MFAVDSQFDATTDGRPIKIVSVIDEHTRECLGGLVERSITADELIGELDRLAAQRGHATTGRSWPVRQWPTGRAPGLDCASSRPASLS